MAPSAWDTQNKLVIWLQAGGAATSPPCAGMHRDLSSFPPPPRRGATRHFEEDDRPVPMVSPTQYTHVTRMYLLL